MNEVPEWFERLKVEWPAVWELKRNYNGQWATLTVGGVAVRVWGPDTGPNYEAVLDSPIVLVEGLNGATISELRENVAVAVSSHMRAWQEVAAFVGGGGS